MKKKNMSMKNQVQIQKLVLTPKFCPTFLLPLSLLPLIFFSYSFSFSSFFFFFLSVYLSLTWSPTSSSSFLFLSFYFFHFIFLYPLLFLSPSFLPFLSHTYPLPSSHPLCTSQSPCRTFSIITVHRQ